ncbi:MAG: FAD-binding protein [Ilumatobacteraceae bacterium]
MNIHEALDTRFDRPGNLDTLVIGAGLAGLISAHEAARAGLRVAVVEGGPVGGRARTTTRAGFALNQGPHAVYDTGELAGALARFGVTVTGGSPNDLVGMVVDRGVLHRLPVAPKDLLTTQVLGARGRAGFARLFAGLSRGDASRFSRGERGRLAGQPVERPAVFELGPHAGAPHHHGRRGLIR